MGVKDGFMESSIIMKLASIFLLIALFCLWIAMTCTGWGENDVTDGFHFGLWRGCSSSNTVPGCISFDGWAADWVVFTQASVVLAFIGVNVAACLVCLSICSSNCHGNKECGVGAAILCLITGVLFLIGIIVFGVKFKEHFIDQVNTHYQFSYAFGLAIPGCLCELVVGVLLLIENCKGRTPPFGYPD